MEIVNELLLLSGNDIPFRMGRCSIHQPQIKEIAYIGEENFQIGSRFLLFDKDNLEMDKSGLEDKSNFEIFMSVMNSAESAKHKTDAIMVLTLMFPNAKVKIDKDKILLQLENFNASINKENFSDFQKIIAQMFCLEENDEDSFNPDDALAQRIAEKIREGQKKRAESKGKDTEKVTIYSKYISILSVGLHKSMIDLSNYTVYQIRDELKRFQLKQDFDMYIQAKLAGAQDLEEVENWMEEIHP